ncbi:hypothetical protein MCO_01286 [Bartonella sp. DB5-6]|uniref:hypothetical protein n=1 Tax=Bartonella sp. DB5-6 TaxID=1094755 RepID=UPI00026E898F|nr:hypothetical protein [Bartonella sp. DB5-6]EJF77371.1 hypothetical protein MCO_01286 [Bartonella sp. DB5-6]
MKEKNMIDLKAYSNLGSNNCEKTFFKKICHSIKELAFIGSLNGSVSGAIAAILAAYGYIALPGFGPIIARGISIAFFAGTIMGAIIGSIMGILVGTFCVFIRDLYISR